MSRLDAYLRNREIYQATAQTPSHTCLATGAHDAYNSHFENT